MCQMEPIIISDSDDDVVEIPSIETSCVGCLETFFPKDLQQGFYKEYPEQSLCNTCITGFLASNENGHDTDDTEAMSPPMSPHYSPGPSPQYSPPPTPVYDPYPNDPYSPQQPSSPVYDPMSPHYSIDDDAIRDNSAPSPSYSPPQQPPRPRSPFVSTAAEYCLRQRMYIEYTQYIDQLFQSSSDSDY